ncbi:MAG TPA: hypothetical protein DEF43_12545 [Chloroflexus aurantiacus]|jgi:hypothetical protein|nr:MAG: hypothetical protein D6716_14245 [Chloroflexota bacterium]HBW67966.1 hypothetical protein [Chloroflexus aurantiacus]
MFDIFIISPRTKKSRDDLPWRDDSVRRERALVSTGEFLSIEDEQEVSSRESNKRFDTYAGFPV